MQFQVSVISLGYRAADFLRKYPDHFLSMHLQDWSAEQKKQVPIGSGDVDWKDLFSAAKNAKIRNYFVEMDMDALGPSYQFLHQLQV
jgi:sugar phosphate isomerase/epimerase